jgi:hypothetical protein
MPVIHAVTIRPSIRDLSAFVIGSLLLGCVLVVGGLAAAATPAPPFRLKVVSCSSPTYCVAIARIPTSGQRGPFRTEAAVSRNRGSSWVLAPMVTGRQSYSALSCPTRKRCIAGGGFNQPKPLIQRSSNGGHSWQAGGTITKQVGISALTCPTFGHCVAVGQTATFRALADVVVSADGGNTWKRVSLANRPRGGLNSVSCPTVTHCVAVGPFLSGILISNSGGRRWTFAKLRKTWMLSAISCSMRTHCVAVGTTEKSPRRGLILLSTTGGSTWKSATIPALATASIQALSCFGPTCVALNATSTDNGSKLLVSSNGGASWTIKSTVDSLAITNIMCSSENTCLVNNLAPSGPLTGATSNGGQSWVARK